MTFGKLLFGRIETSVVLGTILIVLLFAIGTRGLWLSSIPNVLALTSLVGVIAIGQALLMTSGEVDLSVGSVYAFTSVAFLTVMGFGIGVLPAIVAALLVAAAIGFINGVVTTRFKVPSMIVTLGAMFIFRGLTYIQTTGYSLSIPRPYRGDTLIWLLGGKSFGYSHSIVVLLVLAALFVFILARTRLGSHIFAVGGEPEAALSNGVSPTILKIKVFVICSVLAGLAGIVATCGSGSVYSSSGKLLELDTIAACVIGGCTLRGGIGSVWGTILGVFILSSLKGGLMMMGAPTYWYISLVGAILIAFLMASRVLTSRLR